ncbi:unnamed protein product [Pelagomonas calceolata]|uniref:BART domain-containing protein n=1 Tax=Pelagomonas calceolata TaxID=35677 RepID=A0A7S4A620_9STRA|nr:unnamed protein product [Pelagomonas calceolata]|mmetsp:Transcript_12741/g.37938  ORF Transcript_12741/g.37938 Transcript_12741/m.37938 type:complete len:154 (+) Transcript_12741:263-724(+)
MALSGPPPPPVSRFTRTAPPRSPAELVSLVSNYLFDLFDANSMDEYKALEALEDQCMPHTDPDSEEFSFAQQELHATFVRLLESYVEAYIRSLGRTLADFYDALRELKDGSGAPMLDASDCLDTLYEMEDIRCWIDGVKARVRYKRLHGSKVS